MCEGRNLLQCTLSLRAGRLTLRDTSTNGTFVNGNEVGRNETVEVRCSAAVPRS